MKRTLKILIVGFLVAALAIGAFAPAVSAHGGTDDTPTNETVTNATDAYADQMADWMKIRLGPDGVEAFEQETGTSIETVAHAMAEQMSSQTNVWNASPDQSQYGPGWNDGYQTPDGSYAPQMPCGSQMGPGGYGMFGGQSYGPSAYGSQGQGYGPGTYGGQGQGFFGGFGSGSPGGHGMSGHGMGGGMGGGW